MTADLAPRAGAEAARVRPGAVVAGKYRVERIIGQGGMSIVASAVHDDLGERVALKLLKGDAADPERARRILREAQITLRLQSVHVARSLDAGTLPDGSPYLVMELLDGEDLGAVLRGRGPLPVELAVDCVIQVCDALTEAHRISVVHRDLKPSNLFLTRRADGSPLVKVVDFGIAKALVPELGAASGTHGFVGSPLYAAPEQVRDATHVGPAADLFSLGIVLHELLTARLPFEAEGASAALAAIVADPPVRLREHRPDLPAALEALVLRCLEKDPSARPASASALASELARFASPLGRAIAARIVPLEPDAGARARETDDRSALAWGASRGASARRRSGLLAGAAVAAALGGALALVAHARAPEAAAPAAPSTIPIAESAIAPQELPVAASPVDATPESPAASSSSPPEPTAAPAPAPPARAPASVTTHRAGSVVRQPSKPAAPAATAQQADPLGGADIEAATSRRH